MWFFVRDGKKTGGFNLEQMKSFANQNIVNRNTLVWKKGMQDWQPLIVTELKDILLDDQPPPIPGESPPPIPKFPTTYRTIREETESSVGAFASTTIPREEKKRLLAVAKSRIWAHWLFWLVIPFVGGIISNAKCPKKDKKTSNQIIGIQVLTVFFNIMEAFTATGFFASAATICVIIGAVKTSNTIQEARKKLGIADPIEAERELIAESRPR